MGDSPVGIPPLFICDNTADGDAIVRSLSSVGYDVFRVPLTLLLSRVEVQKPSVIIIDVDAPSALGCAQEVRDIPGSRAIRVLFTGQAGRTLNDSSDAEFFEGSGFFPRPVATADVIECVETLVGTPPPRGAGASGVSGSQQSTASGSAPPRSAVPSSPGSVEPQPSGLAPPSAVPLARPLDSVTPSNREPDALSLPPVPGAGLLEDGQALWSPDVAAPQPSPELSQLLQKAELRISDIGNAVTHPPQPPRQPPDAEEEILTPEILATLDEPLDFDEDAADGEHVPWGTRPGTEEGHTGTTGMGTQDLDPPGWKQRSHATAGPREGTEDRSESGLDTGGTEPPTPTPALRRDGRATGAGSRLPRLPSPIPEPEMEGPLAIPESDDAVPTPSPRSPLASAATVAPGPISRMSATEALMPLPPVTTIPSMREVAVPAAPESTGPGIARRDSEEPQSQLTPTGLPRESVVSMPLSFGPLSTGAGTRLESLHPSQQAGASAPAQSVPPTHAPRSPRLGTPKIPEALGRGDSVHALALAVRSRFTGSIALEETGGIRRVVLSDGDFVTVASGVEGESLVEFLVKRGDISRDALALGRKLPQFGRHAGAALVAHGHLRQEDLWPVLRTHSEWLLGRCLQIDRGAASIERTLPARLASEPDVFGGSPGAEVFVEVMRRVISPEVAIQRLHSHQARLGKVEQEELLNECGLETVERQLIVGAEGDTVARIVAKAGNADFAAVLYALHELGVVRVGSGAADFPPPGVEKKGEPDALDDEAIRARIQRKRALVEESDYFGLLGVSPEATGYEIRRAYLGLRKELDPGVLLTARTADLREDLELVLEVLSEAYDILRDDARRERYRRALLVPPRAT